VVRRIVIPALAAAVLAAGCGGGDDKATYISRADAICADAAAKLHALGTPTTAAEFQSFAGKAIPIVEDGLRRVRELDPPKDVAAKADAVFDNVEKGVALVRRIAAAAKKGDAAGLQKLASDASALSAQTGADAKAVGFKECGRTSAL
jgi:hypothetical protein